MKINRITVDEVFVIDQRGIELPMREISDGCRSVYAMILDLVHCMAQVYGVAKLFTKFEDNEDNEDRVFVDRPGVVLIDEVEAHLHPSWQRKLPVWLKEHFPKIQFIVTTHSALIAQAADSDSLFVLPLQDDVDREPRRLSSEETERIRMGRAEKTLLGTAFGLSSSRTPGCLAFSNRVPKFLLTERSQASLLRLESLLGGQASLIHPHARSHGAGDRDLF